MVAEYLMGVLFWGRDLSVVPLCENIAHLRSLVFTFISHRRSNVVGLKRSSLRSSRLFAEDSLFEEYRIGAIHILGIYEIYFSYFVFLFGVNCALLTVTYYSFAADYML